MDNKTVIVSFSSRNSGNCGNIAEYIDDMFDNDSVWKFSSFQIQSCGNCNYECFQFREACPYIDDMECKLLDAICRSDQTIFIVPCYAGYPCSNFFVFNERSQCFFQNRPELLEQYLNVPKKFIVISNTDAANFREAFIQHTNVEPDILIMRAKEYGKNSITGDMLYSEQVRNDLKKYLPC